MTHQISLFLSKRNVVPLLLVFLLLTPAFAQNNGEIVSQWSPGFMDIHHINTGKGECAFLILPDGTTLLIDAGATKRPKPRVTDAKPDDSREPGEWIVRYIQHMLAFKAAPVIDYALLSHFHEDHMGEISEKSLVSESGKYKLVGITRVGEEIPIRKILDRGWPDYKFPEPLESETVNNYRVFLLQQAQENHLVVDRLIPGRNDQIKLVDDPGKYPEFEVRNIAANGEVWTGVGVNTRNHIPALETIPEEDKPSENMCSIALRISYGSFDYFTGGDIPGVSDEGAPSWHDIETPVAKAVGPIDVNVLNHHGYLDSENAFFLSSLRPRVHVIQVWAPSHPSPRTLRRLLSTRLYTGPRDIFATNMMEANRVVIGSNLDELKSQQGHILIRVDPGGRSYRVIVLEDSAETFKIKSTHGPYQSR